MPYLIINPSLLYTAIHSWGLGSDQPLACFAFLSASLSLPFLYQYAYTSVLQELRQCCLLSGLKKIDIKNQYLELCFWWNI